MTVPFVHSNFERKLGDNYKTIDSRCTHAFLEIIRPTDLCIDVCAPSGSGIVDTMIDLGFSAACVSDAFLPDVTAEWIVTNPPYTRPLVDNIINRQLSRIKAGDVFGVAMLLRSTFDHAKSRISMFGDQPLYAGQIKMLFRPWWSEDRSKQPIHNFVWHLWTGGVVMPTIHYSEGRKYKGVNDERKTG